MNLQNFKEVYTKIITESTDDSDLRNYIRTIVERVLNEKNEDGISDAEFYGGDVDSSEEIEYTKDINKLLTIIKKNYNSWIK